MSLEAVFVALEPLVLPVMQISCLWFNLMLGIFCPQICSVSSPLSLVRSTFVQTAFLMVKKIIGLSLAMLSEDYSDNTSGNHKIKHYSLGPYKILTL